MQMSLTDFIQTLSNDIHLAGKKLDKDEDKGKGKGKGKEKWE
jgi:hypothetical protein